MKQVFSTKEAAEYLNLSVASVKYHLYHAKDLKGEPFGNSLMFTKEDLDHFKVNKRPAGRPKIQNDG